MIKRLFNRCVSLTLTAALISSSLTFCLSGCDFSSDSKNADVYSKTYADTALETDSQNLYSTYESFDSALEKNNSVEINKSALNLKDSVNEFLSDFDIYTKEVKDAIKNEVQTIQDRQSAFEEEVKNNAQKVISSLEYIADNSENTDSGKYKESVETISDYFVSENKSITSEEFENGVSHKTQADNIDVNDVENFLKNSVDPVGSNGPNDASLILEAETELSDEIKELAKQLKTPLNVYLYLKNKINYECYYGSRKGAVATFDSCGGNDVDQASLLIAMLRYLGFNSRYVTGTVFITCEQALNLTSAADAKTAGSILVSSGKDVTSISSAGKIIGFNIDQTWVEAYLPYTDYRGAGNASGDYRWIPLDTSIKEYKIVKTIYDDLEKYGVSKEDYAESVSEEDVYKLYNSLSEYEQNNLGEQIYLSSRQIVEENLAYLPLSLQYTVKSLESEYDKISDARSDSISFTVNGQKVADLKPTDIYGKRLILEYEPACESDASTIERYGSIFNVPSYLVKVVPTLKLNGESVGRGYPVTLGETGTFVMNVNSQGNSTTVTNSVTAGSMYQITQDTQTITSSELTKAISEAGSISSSVNEDNIYSDEYLGKILDLSGKLYYAHVDIANAVLAEKSNISATRSLSVGMTGYAVETSTLFGMVVGISEGSLYIDIDLNKVAAISRDGNRDNEYQFMTASGMLSSSFEGVVWEDLTGEEGISTISLFEEAQNQGQEILMLSSANYEKEKSNINADSSTVRAVEQAINAGKIVTMHTDKLTCDEWEGFGYIVTTPETGSASYMISGGLNGGSSSFAVSLSYLVNIGTSIVDMVQALRMIPTVLALFSMGGPVGIVIGTVVVAVILFLVVTAIMDYVNSITLMTEYMNGDEEAGQELMISAAVNVGFSALGAAAGSVSKQIAKKFAEKNIAKALGQELCESILKNADDPVSISKAIKGLRKNGISDDVIKQIAEDNGERGLKLSHQYGENAVKAISGYGSDAVRLIEQYGDNAAKAVANCGSDAIKIIDKYGSDAAYVIGRQGQNAIDIIYSDNAEAFVRAAQNVKDAETFNDIAVGIGKLTDKSVEYRVDKLQRLFKDSSFKTDINVPADIKYVDGFNDKGYVVYKWPLYFGFDVSEKGSIKSITRDNPLPESWDRYGSLNGTNFADVPQDGVYSYSKRSLPYINNPKAYHTGIFNNSSYFDKIDAINGGDMDLLNEIIKSENKNLPADKQLKEFTQKEFDDLRDRYIKNCDNVTEMLDGYDVDVRYGVSGKVAKWLDLEGGANQFVTTLSGEDLKKIGVLIEK